MFAKCLALMLLVPCAALHLDPNLEAAFNFSALHFDPDREAAYEAEVLHADPNLEADFEADFEEKKPKFKGKPPNMIQNQEKCALTFASHSGFGNQFLGALGAGYIAKVTGCTLVMPPVLNHGQTKYGAMRRCQQGVKQEKKVLNSVAPWYQRSSLQYTQIFELNAEIASSEPLTVDPRHLYFLPVHCTLWDEMGKDEEKFAKYLKDFIKNTDPTGSYTIGSGFNTGAPRIEFNELVKSFSPNLAQAISATQDKIATLGKAGKGDYACVHLRSEDDAITQRKHDQPLKDWVKTNMADIGSKPLLIISANLHQNVEDVMGDVCSQGTGCLYGDTVMPEANYGFPDGTNKKLLIELATCAMAQNVYLPNFEKKILIGNVVKAKADNVFKSTFSELIAFMAGSEQMQAAVKQLVEVKAEKKAEKKARLSKKKTQKGKQNQIGLD